MRTATWTRTPWPVLGVLTALTYNTWVFWQPLNGDARIFRGYLSELSASDQPNDLVFRAGDLVTAMIVGLLGVVGVLHWRRRRCGSRPMGRWWLVSAAALVLFGVATFFDAFFAMDCAPILNAACRVAEEAGRLSTVHYAHTVTSVGAQVGIVVSLICAAIALLRTRARGSVARLVVGLAGLEVLALTVMMIMLAAGVPGLGYPQAVLVAAASVWFAVVGIALGVDRG